MTYFTYSIDGEIQDYEEASLDAITKHADADFFEQCEGQGHYTHGETEEQDVVFIEFTHDEHGEMIEVKRTRGKVYYECERSNYSWGC